MAYITFQPHDYFNTLLYTGNGSTNAITGVGFQPDWVWIKRRDGTNTHNLFDAVRGATKALESNETLAEQTLSTALTSFDSDGFTLGSGGDVNTNSASQVSWNWKAGGSGSSNTDGSISSTVSANTTAGFSIAQWTGTGSNATIGHGLGATPKCFIMKKTSATSAWSVYHETVGNTKFMTLNATSDPTTSSTVFNNTSPTSSVFSVGTADNGNASGATYIGYFFAEKKGYSKFGAYTGNGNVNGAFVYTGFKPAVLIVKTYTTNGGWQIYDSKRNTGNATSKFLVPSSNAAEASGSNDIDFLSNGFKTRTTINPGTTDGFIYMAFAEEPLVSSNNIPATAR